MALLFVTVTAYVTTQRPVAASHTGSPDIDLSKVNVSGGAQSATVVVSPPTVKVAAFKNPPLLVLSGLQTVVLPSHAD
ncbi:MULTISPECIES: hypothetical protein [Arthrobacter]|uniref:hypothetical protein n=1 Tax=Arthrobacter TaxID=1663 RepID=UPI0012B5347D|nr:MULTISPECIES: hypothetical protein [Arthrobacter]